MLDQEMLERCDTGPTRHTGTPTSDERPAAVASALSASVAASALAACGGGGEASPPIAPPPAAPPPTPVPPPVTDIDVEQASRFLGQAAWGGTESQIAVVRSLGYAAWLDAQIALPLTQSHFDWMLVKGYGDVANISNFNGVDNTLWRKFISSPDSLRQRIVLALSEIFVISMNGLPVAWRGFAVAAYVDMLEARAFGTYRDLLEAVTLSCGMGVYLNMRGNQKEDSITGRVPDENYAREVMQLFSIGLHELNPDGSERLTPDGKPIETYEQSSISGLARALTGWEFDGANRDDPAFMRKPMVHLANRFSLGSKSFLGVTVPSTASGPQALKLALDTLANHPNVGPFIGRQLIQRLVCSNPSPAYIERVTRVFNDNGSGTRGDLAAVIKTVLLDVEARQLPAASALSSGKLREPVLRFVQWARSFGLKSPTELWNVGNLSDPATRLGMSPLRAPSVFNFFRPGYVPPNSTLGLQSLVAPELQLTNETTVAAYINAMQTVISSGIGELRPDYTSELPFAADANALIERYALWLSGGALGADTKRSIATAVASISASTDVGKLARIHAAILLIMASPEYLVQK